MARWQTYHWLLIVGLSIIGLTWLPVYGVEDQTESSSESQGSKPGMAASQESGSHEERNPTEAADPSEKPKEMTLVEQIAARAKELDEREQALAREAERLEMLRKDLEVLTEEHAQAIEELVKFREAQKVKKKVDPTQKSLAHLIKVYDSMDAEDAAVRLEKMKEPLALDILGRN